MFVQSDTLQRALLKLSIFLYCLHPVQRPTKPGLHPWFRDNIGLAEFIERKRRSSTSSDYVTSSIQKRSPSADVKRRKLARKRAEISPKMWPGFTIHFSLSAAMKSVKRQEKEIYRPNIKPSRINCPTHATATNERKKRAKPVLKRFVFDFESRKWKQELLLEGRTSITTELLIPELSPLARVNKSERLIRKICGSPDTQATSSKYNTLTDSRQSLYTSADDDDDDDDDDGRFCGRDTSGSDVSPINSTTPFSDRSSIWIAGDQDRKPSASRDDRTRDPETTELSTRSECGSPGRSDPKKDRTTIRTSPLHGVPTLAHLAGAVWSEVERLAHNHSVSSIYGLVRPPSGECLSKQRYRILDADSRQDIGEMR